MTYDRDNKGNDAGALGVPPERAERRDADGIAGVPGDAAGAGSAAPYRVRVDDEQTESSRSDYSIATSAKEHAEGRSRIQQLYDLLRGNGGTSGVERARALAKKDQEVEKIGIDLSYVPESIKDIYITIHNLVSTPAGRYRSKVQQLQECLRVFKDSKTEIEKRLYGEDYVGSPSGTRKSSKIGGFYGTVLTLEDKLSQYDDGLIQIDETINRTYQDVERGAAELQKMSERGDPSVVKNMKELRDNIVRYQIDLKWYADVQGELSREMLRAKAGMSTLQREIMGASGILNWLSDQISAVEVVLVDAQQQGSSIDYTTRLLQALPDLKNLVGDVEGMKKGFEEADMRRWRTAEQATEINLAGQPKGQEDRPVPFEGHEGKRDELVDNMLAEARERRANPGATILKMGLYQMPKRKK